MTDYKYMNRGQRRNQIVPTDVFFANKHLKVGQNLEITLGPTRTRKRQHQVVAVDGKGNAIYSVRRA